MTLAEKVSLASLIIFGAILFTTYFRQKKWWAGNNRNRAAVAVDPYPAVRRAVERHAQANNGAVPKEWDHYQAFQAKWSR